MHGIFSPNKFIIVGVRVILLTKEFSVEDLTNKTTTSSLVPTELETTKNSNNEYIVSTNVVDIWLCIYSENNQDFKPRPNALDIPLDSARQMSSDVLLFQRGVAKRSRLSLDFSLDSSQTSV